MIFLGIGHAERSFEMREDILRVFHWDLRRAKTFQVPSVAAKPCEVRQYFTVTWIMKFVIVDQ